MCTETSVRVQQQCKDNLTLINFRDGRGWIRGMENENNKHFTLGSIDGERRYGGAPP